MRRHSASGVGLFMRCPQAWAYNYLDGLRDPEVPWEDIEAGAPCTSRQRSLSLGSATHFALESWYLHRDYDWSRLPGVIAQTAFGQLPDPQDCESVEVEGALTPAGCEPLIVNGIEWNGRLDLTVFAAESVWDWLGITPVSPGVLIDHKTSSNIKRYALTREELEMGLQSNLYGLAKCVEWDVPRITARWSYMQTGRTRKAEPRDFVVERSRAEDVVGKAAEFAHQANALTSSAEAPRNTAACSDYGGCQYHRSAGGPCDARRSVGALIQARVPKKAKDMALSPEMKEKLAKYGKQNDGAASAAAPAGEDAGGGEATPAKPARRKKKARSGPAQRSETPADEPDSETPAPTRTRARKPKKAATRVVQTGDAVGSALASMVEEYQAVLARAAELKAEMRELLGDE